MTADNAQPADASPQSGVRRSIRPEAFLARLPLFAGLPDDVIARLAAATARRDLARGEHLFHQGNPATGIFAVVFGRVKLYRVGADAKEQVVDLVGPGQSFGEPVMFLDKPTLVGAVADADSLVLHVAKEAVFAELKRNERFAARVIGELALRIERLVRDLHDHSVGTGARRFVGWLLRQPMQPAPAGGAVVALPVAKRVLASRLKLSAEHLSRVLRGLAAEKLIVMRGREVTIPDLDRLRAWQLGGG